MPRTQKAPPSDRRLGRRRVPREGLLQCPRCQLARALRYRARLISRTQTRRQWFTGIIREVHDVSRDTCSSMRVHAELTTGMGVVVGERLVAVRIVEVHSPRLRPLLSAKYLMSYPCLSPSCVRAGILMPSPRQNASRERHEPHPSFLAARPPGSADARVRRRPRAGRRARQR